MLLPALRSVDERSGRPPKPQRICRVRTAIWRFEAIFLPARRSASGARRMAIEQRADRTHGIAGERHRNPRIERAAGRQCGNQRPNIVYGVPLTPPGGSTPNDWINIAAFSVPANGAWGNAGRNLITGPALWQLDTAISRRVTLRERVSLELRGECFNLLNRAQFGNPAANISAPSSFGEITTLVNTTGPTGSGTPREFQLAARVLF